MLLSLPHLSYELRQQDVGIFYHEYYRLAYSRTSSWIHC